MHPDWLSQHTTDYASGNHSGRQSAVVSSVLEQDEGMAAANITTLCTNMFLHTLSSLVPVPSRKTRQGSSDGQQVSNFVIWSLKKSTQGLVFPFLTISYACNTPLQSNEQDSPKALGLRIC